MHRLTVLLISKKLLYADWLMQQWANISYLYFNSGGGGLVAKSYQILATPWSPPGSSVLCPWDFPGKSIGVGSQFLLQRIFLTQGLNLDILHFRQILYQLSHQEAPF